MCALFYQSVQVSVSGENSEGTGWIQWLGLAVVGVALSITCAVGIRGAQLVSLDLLLFYFWGIAVFLAPLLLLTIISFDFYTYIDVYFHHHWEEDSFSAIRNIFCEDGTADTKCVSPILGGPNYDNVTEWCWTKYASTDCQDIRDTAVAKGMDWGQKLTIVEASVGVLNLCEIIFSLYLCFQIIKADTITTSMSEVINFLFVIPIAACVGLAIYLWWMGYANLTYSWLSEFFIALAAAQLVVVPVGIYAGAKKNMNMMIGYIVCLVIIISGMTVAGTACMLFSVVLPDEFEPSEGDAADIACLRDLAGCCCCNDGLSTGEDMCPEWTSEEIIQLTVLDLKIAGIVAFLCLVYLFGAITVASFIMDNLRNYKMEYV